MQTFSKHKSLLLYLETRAVDYSGRVDGRYMNDEDTEMAKKWNDEGYLEFGRVCSDDLRSNAGSLSVHLSEQAYADVARFRKERAERGWKNRNYRTTKEKRSE